MQQILIKETILSFVYICMYCTHQLIVVMQIACSPVQDVADSWTGGVSINVIFNLALWGKTCHHPLFAIAVAINVSFKLP